MADRQPRYFVYGDDATDYLKARDAKLGAAIEAIGHIEREVHPDLFAALVNSIVGQQIATKAQKTIWRRMTEAYGQITPEAIAAASIDELQAFGMTFRKAGYIRSAAEKVLDGSLDLEGLRELPDDEVCRQLVALDGVGVWTAEMLMTFSLQRPDIMSFGDLAILRGLRMVERHRVITPALFEKYRRRFSPYGTVASLYLWAVAGGAIEGLTDPAPKKKKPAKRGK